MFAEEPSVRLDYFEIVNPDTLEPVEHISGPDLVAVAAFVGGTRLIDNIVLTTQAINLRSPDTNSFPAITYLSGRDAALTMPIRTVVNTRDGV